MLFVALGLSAAVALLQFDSAAAFQQSTLHVRSLEESSTAASRYGGGSIDGSLMVIAGYDQSDCSGSPITMLIVSHCAVADDACTPQGYDKDGNPLTDVMARYQCADDIESPIDQLFGDATYLRVDEFDDDACTSWVSTAVVLADGECHPQLGKADDGSDVSIVTVVNADGSGSWTSYIGANCSGDVLRSAVINEQQLSSNACVDKAKAYASVGASNETESNETESSGTEGSGNGGARSGGAPLSHLVVAGLAALALATTL